MGFVAYDLSADDCQSMLFSFPWKHAMERFLGDLEPLFGTHCDHLVDSLKTSKTRRAECAMPRESILSGWLDVPAEEQPQTFTIRWAQDV